MSADYYEVLGLKRDCSEQDVTNAFKRLVLEHHPDKGGDPEKFLAVQKAYDVLHDPAKRMDYDDTGFEAGTIEAIAARVLREIITNVLKDIERYPHPLDAVREIVISNTDGFQKKLNAAKYGILRLEDLRKRVRVDPGALNLFDKAVARRLAELEQTIVDCEAGIKTGSVIFDLLGAHTFEELPEVCEAPGCSEPAKFHMTRQIPPCVSFRVCEACRDELLTRPENHSVKVQTVEEADEEDGDNA